MKKTCFVSYHILFQFIQICLLIKQIMPLEFYDLKKKSALKFLNSYQYDVGTYLRIRRHLTLRLESLHRNYSEDLEQSMTYPSPSIVK